MKSICFHDFKTKRYTNIGKFIKGFAPVSLEHGEKGFLCGVIDKKGNEVVPCIYPDVCVYEDGRIFVGLKEKNNPEWHLFNIKTGEISEDIEKSIDFYFISLRHDMRKTFKSLDRVDNWEKFMEENPDVSFDNIEYNSVIDFCGCTIALHSRTYEELLEKKLGILKYLKGDFHRFIASIEEESLALYEDKKL